MNLQAFPLYLLMTTCNCHLFKALFQTPNDFQFTGNNTPVLVEVWEYWFSRVYFEERRRIKGSVVPAGVAVDLQYSARCYNRGGSTACSSVVPTRRPSVVTQGVKGVPRGNPFTPWIVLEGSGTMDTRADPGHPCACRPRHARLKCTVIVYLFQFKILFWKCIYCKIIVENTRCLGGPELELWCPRFESSTVQTVYTTLKKALIN